MLLGLSNVSATLTCCWIIPSESIFLLHPSTHHRVCPLIASSAQCYDHVYTSAAARQQMCEGKLCKTNSAKNLLYPIEAKSGAKSLYRLLNVLCCTHRHLRDI